MYGKHLNLQTSFGHNGKTSTECSISPTHTQYSFGQLPKAEVDQIGCKRTGNSGCSAETAYVYHFQNQKPYLQHWEQGQVLHSQEQTPLWAGWHSGYQSIRPDVVTTAGRHPYLITPQTKFGSRPVISKASWVAFFRECWYRKIRI